MSLHGRHLIGGEASASGSERFKATNPATGETLEPAFAEATSAEISAALGAAEQAHPRFEQAGRATRAALLRGIAEGLEALGDTLIERAHAESGLPHARLQGERGRTTGQLRAFADLLDTSEAFDVRVQPGADGAPDIRTIDRAIGPVAVFGASNFPLAFSVAGGDTAAALAAGCPVVCKAHPAHPGTSELVGAAIAAAVAKQNLPAGVFSLVQGTGHAVGAGLVEHASTRAVGFTGSYAGGRALFDLAQRRPTPIPVYAEMGSVNPVFVLPVAAGRDPAALADQLGGAVCMGVGQFCTNPGILVIRRDTADALLGALAGTITGASPGVMLHAGIAKAYDAGSRKLGAVEGVELVAEAPAADSAGSTGSPRLFRVSASTFLANPELREEVFGPSTLAVVCDDDDAIAEVAAAFEGQLTATIHADPDDYGLAQRLMPFIEQRVGRVVFNGVPTGVAVCEAMHHGGPFPASTTPRETSVGTRAIRRFLRPVCYQGVPNALLPEDLRTS